MLIAVSAETRKQKKLPRSPGQLLRGGLGWPGAAAVLERLDGSREAALLACGKVLVHDVLVGDRVDHALRLLEDGLRSALVARIDGLANLLDCGAQGRTLTHVVSALLGCLTGALASLNGIGHVDIR